MRTYGWNRRDPHSADKIKSGGGAAWETPAPLCFSSTNNSEECPSAVTLKHVAQKNGSQKCFCVEELQRRSVPTSSPPPQRWRVLLRESSCWTCLRLPQRHRVDTSGTTSSDQRGLVAQSVECSNVTQSYETRVQHHLVDKSNTSALKLKQKKGKSLIF